MLYIVTNVSNDNIIIGKGILKPQKEMETYNLEPYKKLIETGKVTVREDYSASDRIYQNIVNTNKPNESEKIDFIKENLKQNLMEALFNFYLKNEISEKDLPLLKWFYKEVALTNKVKKETLNLLNFVDNADEFLEVLLNNVYPDLLDLYLTQERKK